MKSENANPLAELIDGATEGEGRPDESAATQALTAVRGELAAEEAQAALPPKRSRGRPRKDGLPTQPAPALDSAGNPGAAPGAVAVKPELSSRTTKAELRDALSDAERKLSDAQSRLQTLEASSNGQAVENLTLTIKSAVEMVSAMVAVKRGNHWKYEGEEAQALGAAWAQVLARHAQKINEHAPLAVAVAVTWQGVYARVQHDRVLHAEVLTPEVATTPGNAAAAA